VAQAIKEANITGSCYIRVNPSDYELLSPAWESIPTLQPSDRKWSLVADKNVSRGGCMIEADGGILDAQIESQINQVEQALEKLHT
jgi:flagellar biosynthesis/type III secretory pathway protein FliH